MEALGNSASLLIVLSKSLQPCSFCAMIFSKHVLSYPPEKLLQKLVVNYLQRHEVVLDGHLLKTFSINEFKLSEAIRRRIGDGVNVYD